MLYNGVEWNLYCGPNRCTSKKRYDPATKKMIEVPLHTKYTFRAHYKSECVGIAHAQHKFAEGAERVVFQCTECHSLDGGATAYAMGPKLVAKSTRHQERLNSHDFHRTFMRTQGGCWAWLKVEG